MFRYQRNLGTLTEEEQRLLRSKKIVIAGCGGLGGYCAHFLLRSGIERMVLLDDDRFSETDMNRQLFANMKTMGISKAEATKEAILRVNPGAKVEAVCGFLTNANAVSLFTGCDLVIDALDNLPSRLLLQDACQATGLPFVHGDVSRWSGRVSTIFPGDPGIRTLFSQGDPEMNLSFLAVSAAAVASFQAVEAIRVLLGKPSLRRQVLLIDLETNSLHVQPAE